MLKLVFASNNAHKLKEVNSILEDSGIRVTGMQEVGFKEDIDETGTTFRENASIKSHAIHNTLKLDCFADDSGLEVEALQGAPGVYSARFSGDHGDHAANNQKLLSLMKGVENRRASFKTVISLILDGNEYFFEGKVTGDIANQLSGEGGFGYDPLFIPDGHSRTFAQMSEDEKNEISHRKNALKNMLIFLNNRSVSG